MMLYLLSQNLAKYLESLLVWDSRCWRWGEGCSRPLSARGAPHSCRWRRRSLVPRSPPRTRLRSEHCRRCQRRGMLTLASRSSTWRYVDGADSGGVGSEAASDVEEERKINTTHVVGVYILSSTAHFALIFVIEPPGSFGVVDRMWAYQVQPASDPNKLHQDIATGWVRRGLAPLWYVVLHWKFWIYYLIIWPTNRGFTFALKS